MKVSDVLIDCRYILGDSSGAVWADPELQAYYEDAVIELRRLRSDTTKDSDTGAFVPYVAASSTGDDSIVDVVWKSVLGLYMAYRALQSKSGDKEYLQRSQQCFNNFYARIKM